MHAPSLEYLPFRRVKKFFSNLRPMSMFVSNGMDFINVFLFFFLTSNTDKMGTMGPNNSDKDTLRPYCVTILSIKPNKLINNFVGEL